MIRAIYLPEIVKGEVQVYELNVISLRFESLRDKSIKHDKEEVHRNKDWIMFRVHEDGYIKAIDTTEKQEVEVEESAYSTEYNGKWAGDDKKVMDMSKEEKSELIEEMLKILNTQESPL